MKHGEDILWWYVMPFFTNLPQQNWHLGVRFKRNHLNEHPSIRQDETETESTWVLWPGTGHLAKWPSLNLWLPYSLNDEKLVLSSFVFGDTLWDVIPLRFGTRAKQLPSFFMGCSSRIASKGQQSRRRISETLSVPGTCLSSEPSSSAMQRAQLDSGRGSFFWARYVFCKQVLRAFSHGSLVLHFVLW